MTLEIKPMPGKVVIVPEDFIPHDTFLHLPESAKNRDMPERGTVLAIGARRCDKSGNPIDYEFKQGQRVFFPRFSGTWLEVRGHKLIMVAAKDIAAVL